MNASVSSTFWFIFENSPVVQFNTTRSQSHAQPQNGLCLFMCSAAKAGERALPTKRTGNGKRRILRKSNRLQEVKSNKRKRSAYNWKRKWEGRTLINYNKREEITVEAHKYKDTGYYDIVLLWSNCYIPRADLGVGPGGPGTPFCLGSFFFCKRMSDGTCTSSFVN